MHSKNKLTRNQASNLVLEITQSWATENLLIAPADRPSRRLAAALEEAHDLGRGGWDVGAGAVDGGDAVLV